MTVGSAGYWPVPSYDPPDVPVQRSVAAAISPALRKASVGQILPDIREGHQPGRFGWLTWTGHPSVPVLVRDVATLSIDVGTLTWNISPLSAEAGALSPNVAAQFGDDEAQFGDVGAL